MTGCPNEDRWLLYIYAQMALGNRDPIVDPFDVERFSATADLRSLVREDDR